MRKLTAHALTDVGRKRDHNEDAYALDEALGLYVVCDGMGGHASGEVASRMCADLVVEFVQRYVGTSIPNLPYPTEDEDLSQPEALLSNAIQHANDRVFVEGMKEARYEGMGTTIVAVLATADEVVLAHVGDSRIYRWSKDGRLEQVTRDHSLLNHKIDSGEIQTEEDIKGFKQGNIIVRAIGLKDYVEPEVHSIARRPGDLFLLCSDGLTDMVEDWSIQKVLEMNRDDLEEAARALVRMANDRGGKDNITAMFVRVDDPPRAAAAEEITDPRAASVAFRDEDTNPTGVKVVDAGTLGPTMQDFQAVDEGAVQRHRERSLAKTLQDTSAAAGFRGARYERGLAPTEPQGLPTVGDAPPARSGDTVRAPRRAGAGTTLPLGEAVSAGAAWREDDDDREPGFDVAREPTDPGTARRPGAGDPPPVRVVGGDDDEDLAAAGRSAKPRVQVASGQASVAKKRPTTDPGLDPAAKKVIVADEPPSIIIDESLLD